MKKQLVKNYFKKLKFSLLILGIAGSLIFYGCKKEIFSEIKAENEIGGDESPQVITARSGGLGWDYPVRPGMESWRSLQTEEERIAVLQVPEAVLAALSPDEAVRLCITFPMSGHIVLFNTPQESFEVMLSRYNILSHLLSREDVGSILLSAYKDADLSGFKTLAYSNEFWPIKLIYLELLLSQKEILQSLTPEERFELISEAGLKLTEKASNKSFAGLPEILFSVRIIATILDIEKYPEFMNIADREIITRFINTGWLFEDILPINEIIDAANSYIKANYKQEKK